MEIKLPSIFVLNAPPHVERWNKFYLYAGLLDDISILKKSKNIYYEESHFPFMEISEKNLKT